MSDRISRRAFLQSSALVTTAAAINPALARHANAMAAEPPVTPRRHGPSRAQVRRRRFVALLVVVVAVVVAVVAVAVAIPKSHDTAPTTALPPPPKPFRIVFPEGFTRDDMAHRVAVVAKIAERKSHKHVALSQSGYLHWSQPRSVAGFGSKKRNLEGFLFPATYDFLRTTTSKQLVQDQLDAFKENWGKVNL